MSSVLCSAVAFTVRPPVCLSVCLSVCVFVRVAASLSVCLSVCPYISCGRKTLFSLGSWVRYCRAKFPPFLKLCQIRCQPISHFYHVRQNSVHVKRRYFQLSLRCSTRIPMRYLYFRPKIRWRKGFFPNFSVFFGDIIIRACTWSTDQLQISLSPWKTFCILRTLHETTCGQRVGVC